jgi:hypothetical protein
MAEQQTRAQRVYDRVSGGNFDVAGIPVGDIVGVVSDVFRRRPNVKAWAQAKRKEKRRLKALGITKKEQRQRLSVWLSNNPRPKGSEPYNPLDLGISNQMNPNAMALNQNEQLKGGSFTGTTTQKAGFNPMWLLLLAIPLFFINRKGRRKKINILGLKF